LEPGLGGVLAAGFLLGQQVAGPEEVEKPCLPLPFLIAYSKNAPWRRRSISKMSRNSLQKD